MYFNFNNSYWYAPEFRSITNEHIVSQHEWKQIIEIVTSLVIVYLSAIQKVIDGNLFLSTEHEW